VSASPSWNAATADWNTATDLSGGIVPNDENTDRRLRHPWRELYHTVSITDADAALALNGTGSLNVISDIEFEETPQ
jgi:hypothetical protein